MILLFYGANGEAAKVEAAKRRAEKEVVRATECYACREAEPADGIEFLGDVPETERVRLNALFGIEAEAPAKKRGGKGKPSPVDAPADPADELGPNGLTRREMNADLEATGIEPDPTLSLDDLAAQHAEARTAAE